MSDKDIRWIQRFNHFNNALNQLTKFIEKGSLNELEEQGLIHSFENTYELAWKTIRDYFEDQAKTKTDIYGSRDAFQQAFKFGLIEDGEVWMKMVESRILTNHAYNEEIARDVVEDIVNSYFPEFVTFRVTMRALKQQEENSG